MMTRKALFERTAAAMAVVAVMMFAVAPFFVAAHSHNDHPAEAHCAVCILASTVCDAQRTVAILNPTLTDVGTIPHDSRSKSATTVGRVVASRAPPSV